MERKKWPLTSEVKGIAGTLTLSSKFGGQKLKNTKGSPIIF